MPHMGTHPHDQHSHHSHHGHHSHCHSHHGHSHHGSATGARLVAVIVLTSTILVAEVIGAIWSGSLALLADAGHMATDSVGLVMAGLALYWGKRKATQLATYGFSRAEVIASALNALMVMAIAVWILVAAIRRIHNPAELAAEVMLLVATIGLLANLLAMLALHKPSQNSLNIKGAYLHIVSDMLSSIGVIFASLVVWATGWTGVDILVSVLIMAVLLPRCWQLLKQSFSVLMQHAPAGLDYVAIQRELLRLPGVERVYDLHLWSLTGSDAIATVHIVAAPHGSSQLHEHQEILRQVEAILRSQFGITRTTVQIEFSPPGAERADECVHSPHCAQSAHANAATSIPARAAAHHPDTTEHQGWQLWDKTAVSCRRNWRASVVRASGNRYHLTS